MAFNDDVEKLPAEPSDVTLPVEKETLARGDFDARPKRKKNKINGKTLWIAAGLIVGLISAIVIIIMVAVSQMSGNNQIDESKVKADAALQRVQGKDDALIDLQRKKEKEAAEIENIPPEAPPEQTAEAATPPQNAPSGNDNQNPPSDAPPVQDSGIFPNVGRFQSSGLSAGSAGGNGTATNGQDNDPEIEQIRAFANASPPAVNIGSDGSDVVPDTNRGSLSNLSGTGFAPAKAHIMPSRKYLVTHNTYARCALYTEVITDQPGLVECRLTEPLYSSDGSVVIAYAGDKLTGEQKVEVRAGQTRVFTSWTELETASGVRAQLNSLGAGPMGASGTNAWIDNHYMQRFGGAVMLSFIQDALQSAANSTQRSGSGYTVNNSEQNVESMANKALENSINIPPTAYILPGTVITVIVARDIDFSSVFGVR